MKNLSIFKNSRVIVTGHTGFKGSWLCAWLLELGAKVAGYSVDVPTKPSHFEALQLSDRIYKGRCAKQKFFRCSIESIPTGNCFSFGCPVTRKKILRRSHCYF